MTARPGLPDILEPGLRLVFVGYNPSLAAARAGHYYAGKQNFFYRLLYGHGFTPVLLAPHEDHTLPQYGIGLTDLCPIPSAQAAHLPRGALRAGRDGLRAKLERYQPRLVCFNGLGVYRAFTGQAKVYPGPQPEGIGTIRVSVVPSTSPANNGLLRERDAAFAELVRLYRS